MKRTICLIGVVAATIILISLPGRAAKSVAVITGFTAIQVKGDCKIKTDKQPYKAIVKGATYGFGSTVKTGRNSSLTMQFFTGNTFRLLARTILKIDQDTKNPKLKKLRLETGKLSLKLDDMPRDSKIQVETPTAVCGAVGTRFVVSFEDAESGEAVGSRKNRFSCDKGEIRVANRFSIGQEALEGNTFDVPKIQAGGDLVAVIHEGLENTYTDITVNRGKLTFNYGGKKGNTFSVEPARGKPTRFVCSLEKSAKDINLMAMKVEEGVVTSENRKPRIFRTALIEKTEIKPVDGAIRVKAAQIASVEDKKKKEDVAADYIQAAKKEGELHSELMVMQQQPAGNQAALDAKEKEMRAAAKQATKIRNRLLARRTTKILQQLRRSGRLRSVPKRR